MEQKPGQDPDRDDAAAPQPGQAAPGPDDAGFPDEAESPGDTPGSAPPGITSASTGSASGAAGSAPASSGTDSDSGDPDPGSGSDGDGDGECVFGDWDALEGTLHRAKARAELLSGFAPGGVWDGHPPGPELATALAQAVGPQWRCSLATGPELIGLLRGMAAMHSWTGAGLMGIIRALIRDDDLDFVGRPKHGDLPDEWDDSLVHEIALALAVSVPSAEKTTRAAWDLGARLPGVELLLRDGTLDLQRARLIAEVFGDLSDQDCAKAEKLLLPELTAPPRKTWTQIEKLATLIALEVDPDLAERRRKAAERHRARVRMFREPSGTAGLSGRDLPTDETLAAFAHVAARAQQYKDSGAFPGERIDRLRATAYLDILNDVATEDRIAYGRLSADGEPDDAGQESLADRLGFGSGGSGGEGPAGQPAPGSGESGDPEAGGPDCPCDECDGCCAPPDDDFPDDEPDDAEPDDNEPDGDGPGDDQPGDSEPGDDDFPDEPGDDGPGDAPRGGGNPPANSDPGGDDGPDPGGDDKRGAGSGDGPRPTTAPPAPRPPILAPDDAKPALTDLVLPLATLLGRARRPGEGHGLGALDPALCQGLASTAIRSPDTTLCVTVTDPDGIAIGHGCAKPSRRTRPPDGPAPPLVALPARINLTITTAHLANSPPPGPLVTGWALARQGPGLPGDPDWCGPWTLTVPAGLDYRMELAPVPTHDCDHRNESHAYKPNATLRHLVQVRDHTCTFPTCNRHARDSDFEHALPYDQGGRTCACNAGARSRKCHRVKQSPGWNVAQPTPGWHQWTTPRGRTYTQGPKHYPV